MLPAARDNPGPARQGDLLVRGLLEEADEFLGKRTVSVRLPWFGSGCHDRTGASYSIAHGSSMDVRDKRWKGMAPFAALRPWLGQALNLRRRTESGATFWAARGGQNARLWPSAKGWGTRVRPLLKRHGQM